MHRDKKHRDFARKLRNALTEGKNISDNFCAPNNGS
jgi:hypothetical protein